MSTEILTVDEISQSDNDKFVTHNTANRQIEGQITRVISRTNSGPPVSPSNGDIYIVDSATGDWSARSVNDIAHYFGGQWVYYSPVEGAQRFWVNDEDIVIGYDGSAWVNMPLVSVFGGTSLVAGAVPFINATADGLALDATNFFWDDSNNRLGIGTNSPGSMLSLYSNDTGNQQLKIEQDGTGDASMAFILTGATAWGMGADNSDSDKFKIGSSTSLETNNHLTLTTGGNLGINTDTPGVKLDVRRSGVNGAGLAGVARIQSDAKTASDGLTLGFAALDSTDVVTEYGALGVIITDPTNGSEDGDLVFRNISAGSVGERMRLTSDSKLGIGTSAPAQALVVNGGGVQINGAITSPASGTSALLIDYSTYARYWARGIDATTVGQHRFYVLENDGGNQSEVLRLTNGGVEILPGTLILGEADTASGHINAYELMTFNIDTDNDDSNRYFAWLHNSSSGAGNELMRLDESGNLGVGGTSSGERLLLEGSATAGARLVFSQTTAGLTSQVQQGSTGMSIAANGAQAMLFETNGTERMRLTSSGNVGIGSTSPSGVLEVNTGSGLAYFTRTAGDNGTTNPAMAIGLDSTSVITRYYGAALKFEIAAVGGSAAEKLRLTNTGQLSTNGESAPDVDAGGICINHGANDGAALTIKNSDVAHGFTGLEETDTYLSIRKSNSTAGGARIRGFTEGSSGGLNLQALSATTTSTFANGGTIYMNGSKSDGGTGATALASGDNLASIANDGTVQLVVKGDGDIYTSGGISFDDGTNLLDQYEEGTWTPVIADASSGGNTATFTNSGATYTRIGRQVTIHFNLENINTAGMTAGNDVYVRGLPFTSGALIYGGSLNISNITYSGELVPQVQNASTVFRLLENISGSGGGSTIVSDLTSGSADIRGTLTYYV